MVAPAVRRHDKNKLGKWLHKWFGTNRGTHWTVAGSVGVIIFSSYLIYNSRDSNPTTSNTVPAAEGTPAPMTPGPFILKR
jgi:hypothetical protein